MPRKSKNNEDKKEPAVEPTAIVKEQTNEEGEMVLKLEEPIPNDSNSDTSSTDQEIEKKPRKPRVKKPRSEAQLKAFERAAKIRLDNLAKLRVIKDKEKEKEKIELEEHVNKIRLEQEQEKKQLKEKLERRIIDKAIKIKKKKMKQIKEIDDVSSDSDTKETVKRVVIPVDPYKAFKDKFKLK